MAGSSAARWADPPSRSAPVVEEISFKIGPRGGVGLGQ